MPLISDAAVPKGDLARRVEELERRFDQMQAARSLEAAQFGAGGITVSDTGGITITDEGFLHILRDDGTLQFRIGPLYYAGVQKGMGWTFYRYGGSLAFSLEGATPDAQFVAVRDEAGNIVFSDDAASGQGLATPYIPGGQFTDWVGFSLASTTSSSFTRLQKAFWYKQHPKIWFRVLHNVTSTQAELRWKIVSGPDTGTVLDTVTVSGFLYTAFGPYSLPGDHLTEFEIDLEARVSSGSGSVGVRTVTALGVQS